MVGGTVVGGSVVGGSVDGGSVVPGPVVPDGTVVAVVVERAVVDVRITVVAAVAVVWIDADRVRNVAGASNRPMAALTPKAFVRFSTRCSRRLVRLDYARSTLTTLSVRQAIEQRVNAIRDARR